MHTFFSLRFNLGMADDDNSPPKKRIDLRPHGLSDAPPISTDSIFISEPVNESTEEESLEYSTIS